MGKGSIFTDLYFNPEGELSLPKPPGMEDEVAAPVRVTPGALVSPRHI